MRGTVERRGEDRWRVRAFAGRDETGKIQWVSQSVVGGKRDAQRALAKLVTELQSGQVVAGHPTTIGELIDQWLADISPHRSPSTMREYRRIAEANVKPALGKVLVTDGALPRRLDHFYRSLTDRGLSPTSVRRHHALLHAALGRGVKWGMIVANPADRATAPKAARHTVTAPDAIFVQRLISAAEAEDDHVLATAIALGAVTGARRGELCALRWSDVDWERRSLRIARSLTVIKRAVSEGPTKTHQVRMVALEEVLEAFLVARHRQQEEYAREVGAVLVADPFILSRSADGSRPCLPDGLTSAYVRLASRVGVDGHLHQLRHFAATTAIGSGADIRTVAARLGHADASTTLRIYTHALEQRDRELAGVLARAVFAGSIALELAPKGSQVAPLGE